MQYLAVLGRQPKISLAELEAQFSDIAALGSKLAIFSAKLQPSIARLGGSMKLAKEIHVRPEEYLLKLDFDGKFVVGLSDYSKNANAKRSQFLALKIKRALKKRGKSARVLENKAAELSSATVFHNQLGEKAGHVEFIKYANRWFVLIGVQNINAYRDRDQNRPARDAKVGMLPPKLAQILINLCGPLQPGSIVLDPFCGTGVILQEALLLGYKAYGTDASERMVEYATRNIEWLTSVGPLCNSVVGPAGASSPKCAPNEHSVGVTKAPSPATPNSTELCQFSIGDATDFTWQQPIDAVVFEGYLGPPMSETPADIKMKSVISDLLPLYYHTLRNLSSQIRENTPIVMAIPAWLRPDGSYYRLNILDELDKLGYNVVKYKNLSQKDLLYARAGQIVAREIIVLRKK